MADLEKDQLSIFDILEPEEPKEPKAPAEIWAEETGFSDYWQHDTEFINDKPVCTYSKHSCNRKELWNIADTLDGICCTKQCCRNCNVLHCGARCNGSEEPVQKKTLSFDEFKEHCRHNGWTKPATETEPSHVMCSFNNRQNAKCWEDWIICSLENCPLLK